jgi:hypothetical protein
MKLIVTTKDDGKQDAKRAIARMQSASVFAVTQTVEDAKSRGRASIAAGGFSAKWQNALRSRVYPNANKPLSPAGIVWHKIRYANVFEQGATIRGKPLLWLPLPTVPLGGRGSHPLTPAQYRDRIGELRSVNRPGKAPLLIGRGSREGITRASATSVRVRKRAVKAGSILGQWVPLYVGVPSSNVPKRFDLRGAVRLATERIDDYYKQAMGKGE